MRISSGSLKGRRFEAPKGFRTHPMGDRTKTALFNILGSLSGHTVLDAYAGSGALAFESLSRGAEFAQLIEVDRKAVALIQKNIQDLGLENQAKLTRANAASWSDRNSAEKFDVVICDPPFDRRSKTQIEKLARHVAPGGTLVVSQSSRLEPLQLYGFSRPDVRSYGDQQLIIYLREA